MGSRHFWKIADCAPPLDHPEHRKPRDVFGGGGGGTVNTVQKSDPWKKAQPYLEEIFAKGQGLYGQGGYQGPYLAGQSPFTQQAIQMQGQRAQAGSPLLPAAQNEMMKTMGGDYLSVDSNPYLKGAVQTALDQASQGVSGRFGGDNVGGSANQEWLGRTLANTALPIYAQNYQQERGRQLAAVGGAPQMAMADYADIGQLAGAGAAMDSRAQSEIGAAQQASQAPWDVLGQYNRLISGGAQLGGSSMSQNPYFTNPLASAMGMGLGGLSLYNGLGAAGLMGGGGAAMGGAGASDLLSTMMMFA